MDAEEVLIKLGFRTDSFSAEGRKLADEIDKAGKKSASAFIQAESEGRTFNKVMKEISSQSPLLGVALQSAMNPIVGIMIAIVTGFNQVKKAFAESAKFMDDLAAKEAKNRSGMEESFTKGIETVQKRKEAHADFQDKVDKAFKNEQERDAYNKRIAEAEASSGGDTAEFLRKKKVIDLEEQARIEGELRQAQEREADLERGADDRDQAARLERLKTAVKELAAEEEKAQKEASRLGMSHPLEIGGTPLFASGLKHQEKLIEAQDKANRIREQRERIEETIRNTEARERERVSEQKQAQDEIVKAPAELGRIKKELAEDDKKLRELDRKEKAEAVKQEIEEAKILHDNNKIAFLTEKIAIEEKALAEAEAAKDKKMAMELEKQLRKDNLELAAAQKEKDLDQAKLDREVAHTRQKRAETERQPFMPTLAELANSMPWQVDYRDQHQRLSDETRMRMGMAYGQKFAGDAQELERLKDDAKRALFIEGPESTRFKDDLKRIESLKKGLAAAGLQTSDNRLESIDRHMQDLVDKASKDGLVVQPVNGE